MRGHVGEVPKPLLVGLLVLLVLGVPMIALGVAHRSKTEANAGMLSVALFAAPALILRARQREDGSP